MKTIQLDLYDQYLLQIWEKAGEAKNPLTIETDDPWTLRRQLYEARPPHIDMGVQVIKGKVVIRRGKSSESDALVVHQGHRTPQKEA